MSVDRRHFLKGIVGSSLVALLPASAAAISETVECRIQRLFVNCAGEISNNSTVLPTIFTEQTLMLRRDNECLHKLSDHDFIEMLDNNIRQDFAEGQIIDLAGWQLASTEVAIMNIVRMGAAYHS